MDDEYRYVLKKTLDAFKKDLANPIEFISELYEFNKEELKFLVTDPDKFLIEKYSENHKDKFDSVVFVPSESINLKDNYIWYSIGAPDSHVMVISSYIFNNLIKERLDFGSYILLIYSQFLARYAVDLKQSHYESRNCLNDHCAYQIELLNVLNNEKDVLCDQCLDKITDQDNLAILRKTLKFVKYNYLKKAGKETVKSIALLFERKITPKEKVSAVKQEVKLRLNEGYWYEFECYMAKKCANLSELYKRLNGILCDPNYEINGYSLYEVEGGWRSEINLTDIAGDIKKLRDIREKLSRKGYKDVVRPILIKGGQGCVTFDESSIVLRIIIKSEAEIISFDKSSCKAIREIVEIFKQITKNEESIFFTAKKLSGVGSIERIKSS